MRCLFLEGIAFLMLASAPMAWAEARLVSFTRWDAVTASVDPRTGETVFESGGLEAGVAWDRMVASWNAAPPLTVEVEVSPRASSEGRFFSFGRWTAQPVDPSDRSSIGNQREAGARMDTDTLILPQPVEGFRFRVRLRGPRESLKRLSFALSRSKEASSEGGGRKAWDRSLEVPVLSQADHPEGVTKWCSPACTAMLVSYWADDRGRPEWRRDIPEVARGVFDPGWGGTGNWSFNMAYAGAVPGLNAAVSRFRGLADLEQWVAAGAPAAVSVSYAQLQGKPTPEPDDGHLVVVRGFTATGDVRVHDPGVRRERVQRVIPRTDFARAWTYSDRTVYLVWPDGFRLPEGPVFPR
ncbi:MAG: C39 family peptidase [Limisphaerales bacterium]